MVPQPRGRRHSARERIRRAAERPLRDRPLRRPLYSITDLTWQQASPQRLGRLGRSQWTIESRLHFVRDTTLAEDASTIRTGHGPDNMATLRNLAINTLRAAEHSNIAAGLRHAAQGVTVLGTPREAAESRPPQQARAQSAEPGVRVIRFGNQVPAQRSAADDGASRIYHRRRGHSAEAVSRRRAVPN
ncbi:hypothetical protein [Streptomyces eurythermus]|uniref:hypothetical protein n=1 Tax=Streptomyces eurythermus TaxID=42237 RepID=UPI0033D4D37E